MDMFSTAAAYFHKGGYVMYILLLCSIFVVTIAVERARFFARADVGRAFGRKFCEAMGQGEYDVAQSMAGSASGILPEILTGVFHLVMGKGHGLSGFLEVQSGIALSQFRRRLYYLNVIVTLSPLLGLLGTIIGMISAFSGRPRPLPEVSARRLLPRLSASVWLFCPWWCTLTSRSALKTS